MREVAARLMLLNIQPLNLDAASGLNGWNELYFSI